MRSLPVRAGWVAIALTIAAALHARAVPSRTTLTEAYALDAPTDFALEGEERQIKLVTWLVLPDGGRPDPRATSPYALDVTRLDAAGAPLSTDRVWLTTRAERRETDAGEVLRREWLEEDGRTVEEPRVTRLDVGDARTFRISAASAPAGARVLGIAFGRVVRSLAGRLRVLFGSADGLREELAEDAGETSWGALPPAWRERAAGEQWLRLGALGSGGGIVPTTGVTRALDVAADAPEGVGAALPPGGAAVWVVRGPVTFGGRFAAADGSPAPTKGRARIVRGDGTTADYALDGDRFGPFDLDGVASVYVASDPAEGTRWVSGWYASHDGGGPWGEPATRAAPEGRTSVAPDLRTILAWRALPDAPLTVAADPGEILRISLRPRMGPGPLPGLEGIGEAEDASGLAVAASGVGDVHPPPGGGEERAGGGRAARAGAAPGHWASRSEGTTVSSAVPGDAGSAHAGAGADSARVGRGQVLPPPGGGGEERAGGGRAARAGAAPGPWASRSKGTTVSSAVPGDAGSAHAGAEPGPPTAGSRGRTDANDLHGSAVAGVAAARVGGTQGIGGVPPRGGRDGATEAAAHGSVVDGSVGGDTTGDAGGESAPASTVRLTAVAADGAVRGEWTVTAVATPSAFERYVEGDDLATARVSERTVAYVRVPPGAVRLVITPSATMDVATEVWTALPALLRPAYDPVPIPDFVARFAPLRQEPWRARAPEDVEGLTAARRAIRIDGQVRLEPRVHGEPTVALHTVPLAGPFDVIAEAAADPSQGSTESRLASASSDVQIPASGRLSVDFRVATAQVGQSAVFRVGGVAFPAFLASSAGQLHLEGLPAGSQPVSVDIPGLFLARATGSTPWHAWRVWRLPPGGAVALATPPGARAATFELYGPRIAGSVRWTVGPRTAQTPTGVWGSVTTPAGEAELEILEGIEALPLSFAGVPLARARPVNVLVGEDLAGGGATVRLVSNAADVLWVRALGRWGGDEHEADHWWAGR